MLSKCNCCTNTIYLNIHLLRIYRYAVCQTKCWVYLYPLSVGELGCSLAVLLTVTNNTDLGVYNNMKPINSSQNLRYTQKKPSP